MKTHSMSSPCRLGVCVCHQAGYPHYASLGPTALCGVTYPGCCEHYTLWMTVPTSGLCSLASGSYTSGAHCPACKCPAETNMDNKYVGLGCTVGSRSLWLASADTGQNVWCFIGIGHKCVLKGLCSFSTCGCFLPLQQTFLTQRISELS